MKILAIGDPHGKVPRNLPMKDIDFALLTGDIGEADIARRIYLTDRLKGIIPSKKDKDAAYKETYDSTMRLLKKISNGTEVYSIMGNVSRDSAKVIRDAKKIKKVHIVKNSLRIINGLRVGFLEYFVDNCWINEFKEKDKKKIQRAKKETAKAKMVLTRFGYDLDILVCHQPPYGVLDKVGGKAPKHWRGKHAGSKVVLDYVKKFQPKYVICGHIHEGAGERIIGKTKVINLGMGDYQVLEI